MNRRALAALGLALALPASAVALQPADAAATRVPPPMKLVSTGVPGPNPGDLTVTWRQVKSSWTPRTTGFRIETATTQFSPNAPSLPVHGRHSHVFTVGASTRKLVIPAATMATIGAPLASGNHLYVRVTSLDHKAGHPTRTYSDGTHAMSSKGMASTGGGPVVRMADYNVRVAGNDSGTSHDWYQYRLPLVARNIANQHPGIVTLQEANPTSYAPYSKGGDHEHTQLLTLIGALNADAGTTYKAVRTTYYADYINDKQYDSTQQGERILYDMAKYTLLSDCPEMTKDTRYRNVYAYFNPSCSIQLPLLPGDSAQLTRWAAYGHFRDNTTGQTFWVVSVHLDNRAGNRYTKAQQAAFDDLRAKQGQTVLDRLASLDTTGEPVLFAGDTNTSQNSPSPHGNAVHDLLVRNGFYDTFAAATRSGYQYDTENGYGANAARDISGIGARIDAILVKGAPGADTWTHVRYHPGAWPSDHDMIVAAFRLP